MTSLPHVMRTYFKDAPLVKLSRCTMCVEFVFFITRLHLTKYLDASLNISEMSLRIMPYEEKMRATGKTSELEAALKGIVMIKETYNLDVANMARGSRVGAGLSYNDLYLMAGMV